MIIYTTGYLGSRTRKGDTKAARLAQLVEQRGLILADIRDLPWSQAPCWRKAALEARLGERYVHIPELGNATRRTGLITIRDMNAGLDRLLALPRPPLLLCCCSDFWDCHREEVARAVVQRPGVSNVVEIVHWEPFQIEVPIFGPDKW